MESFEDLQLADVINEIATSIQSYSQLAFSAAASNFSPVAVVRTTPPREFTTELVDFSNWSYSIWDLYTPDVWSLLLFFVIAVGVKLLFVAGLNQRAVKRTQIALAAKWGTEVDEEVARAVLKKPWSYVVGWILTIVLETCVHPFRVFGCYLPPSNHLTCMSTMNSIVFVLQCCSWRLWRIDDRPLRSEDVHLILGLIKVLLIGYAGDLLLCEKGYDIYLHHCFSFILLFVGQCALFSTHNASFPRLATWMILQSTAAFPLYFGLGLVQVERYLHVQKYNVELQKRALRYSYYFLRFMTWIYIPQKVVPAAFCIYWIGCMWNDVRHSGWGIAWLTCATLTIPLLLLLQIFVLSDSVASMTNYIGYKVYGGPLPSKRGPIARFVSHLLGHRRSTSAARERSGPVSSEEKANERKDADERATNASSKSSTPLFFVNLAEDAGRKGSVGSSLLS
ncbi:hypothetical protein JCM11491_004686 [Sporobolomyces phaffii]